MMPKGFAARLLILVVTLVAESLIVGSLPHPWFHPQQIMAAPIVFAATFLFFSRRKLTASSFEPGPLHRPFLLLHLLSLTAMIASTFLLLRLIPPGTQTNPAVFSSNFWWVIVWYAAILAVAVTLAGTLFPLRQLLRTLVGLRMAWVYAALTTVATMSARTMVRLIWDAPNSSFGRALQEGTFAGTRFLLEIVYPHVIAIPSTHELGTSKFVVEVAGTCSGIEGLALMLIFTVGWLIFARRELHVGRAVLLVPVALALSWGLNLVRIALLIAIGDAGHPDTAINGFHSEAGWIMFNVVAIGFLLAVQRLRWLQRLQVDAAVRTGPTFDVSADRTASYLMPFLAVLATSLLTHAASSGFDWLYPLRLLVAAVVLWHYRKDYRHLNWRFGWLGPAIGAVIFVVWVGAAHFVPMPVGSALSDGLARISFTQRLLWLTARTLAAVLTVPIAEELAFRGYLARRISSADVESVPLDRLSWLGIAVSSIVFGLLHGGLWQVGIVAGAAFAVVAKRRNRIGEAIAAHAMANLLLAVWVLTRHDYSLW